MNNNATSVTVKVDFLNELNAENFGENVIELITTNGFDGIDLDWEFPETTNESRNLVLLVDELRSKFDEYDPPFLLGMATNPGSWVGGRMKYEEMINSLDWFAMMGYDFHGRSAFAAGPKSSGVFCGLRHFFRFCRRQQHLRSVR